jgi:3-oxoisoapionate kinase
MNDLLLSFYGDDFTGSTDAMESLARAGLRTVLFLDPPTPAQLRRFPGLRAFGVAGTGRTMTPAQMARELPPIFRALKDSGAPLVHYKMCSTFDSSPRIGSIGKAIDVIQEIFRSPFVPLLVGAPMLGRYCVFGNLFARSGLDSEPHRLDRHPTMRHHPTTPMDEADLRRHLAKQTRKTIGLLDVVQLESPDAAQRLGQLLDARTEIVLFDVFHDSHLPRLGELIGSRASPDHPLFVVGSSCVEYALAAWWRKCGTIRTRRPKLSLKPASALVVVSGSCSPVTDRQIGRALEAGFAEIALDTPALVHPKTRSSQMDRVLRTAAALTSAHRGVILHTARGPQDPRLASTQRVLKQFGLRSAATLGTLLGELLARVLAQTGWTRGAVTGGDTSSFAARALGVEALEFLAPIAPGAPLCRVHAPGQPADGREIVFKGGQNGRDDFFLSALHGGVLRSANP